MSLVGNFTFGNYDGQNQRSGVGALGGNANNRDHHMDQADNSHRATHLNPQHSTQQPSQSQDTASRQTSHTMTTQKLDPSHTGTGIHDGTYYPDGITPSDEKTELEPAESPTSSQSEAAYDRDEKVHDIARTLSRTMSQAPDDPFTYEEDSPLNPNGPNFKAREWVKSMFKLTQREGDKNPQRTAGIAFKNLNVHGYGADSDYQKTVSNVALELVGLVRKVFGLEKKRRIDILRDFEGVVRPGEMLVVLGPPGSGCSTFLKTLTGETHGFTVDNKSYLNYQGIEAKDMNTKYRGEAIYTAEVDCHFPNMSVGDTLYFASRARAPRHIPGGLSKVRWAEVSRDMIMATFGISHTINTQVGNDFIRGVSGGERKRVSIAEAALSGAPLQAWDNSTRGLDSANAVEFCKTLRLSSEFFGTTPMVAIYQAPGAAYDLFDKVIVLYEGRQIYFGPIAEAKNYFVSLGFDCPDRQTDADFLTSMTSPQERVVRKGWENKSPRSSEDFATRWKESPQRQRLLEDIDAFDKEYPFGGESNEHFAASRKAQKASGQRTSSPYTLSYPQQVKLCLWRGFQRLKGDPSLTFTQLFGNFMMALVIGSLFYNLDHGTDSFYSRGALIFFAILMNAFGSALEILTLYAQRPIVEKHSRYALYHPSAEAFASMLTDMPYKIMNAFVFNTTLYFLTNLRREAGAFFFFVLISFFLTLTMSMLFRTIASVSRTLSQAMAPAAILILAIVIFTGFTIPTRYMLGWSRWINYLDPVAYGFESLMINEFHGQNYPCSAPVPLYGSYPAKTQVCGTVGAVAGNDYVNGDAYINSSYGYYHSHKWRNFGIVCCFMVGLMCFYLAATEFISAKKSKGEVLVFRRGHKPAALTKNTQDDLEAAGVAGAAAEKEHHDVEASNMIQKQTAVFHWEDVCYDIKIKKEDRRILDHVDGFVKPGSLTALMGVSGAGKTTLLDVLATRVTMGVISGDMFVDGRSRDDSFQRKTGYVQQQDLHLQTSTVREALNFSALLRQPGHVSRQEKLDYVDEVIKLLDMDTYADAVVGVPGEGLNVEQRKRLTIGVELAAKPELLLFLDEPTSGLDSQTSWAICDLMEKLTKSGQAILCTIHQPSAMLFQRFDRLLFLAKGGRTVYFGEVGKNSNILTKYFERNGAHKCPPDANPAEWMLEVIGAAPGTSSDIDWHQTWRDSQEYRDTKTELARLRTERPQETKPSTDPNDQTSFREFAAPFGVQFMEVTKRVFVQYWRTPSYIFSKLALCTFSALFIGFVFFKAQNTQQGLQNQLFSIFMLFTIFGQLVQQIMPHFVTQRALYEVRERPSKTYSWKAFMLSNILVELPWNSLGAVIIFFCFYYPIGLYRNAVPTNAVTERGGLFFLFVWQFLLFTSTFTNMVIAGIETAETGGNIANLMFSLCLVFCGVLVGPTVMPGFWIFVYRLSPFSYLVDGMLSVAVANTQVHCADNEYLFFSSPVGQTCGSYMASWISSHGGYLENPSASDCQFCQIEDTNVFLASVSTSYSHRWRSFGIMWAFIIFNAVAAVGIYWLARVPKKAKKAKKE